MPRPKQGLTEAAQALGEARQARAEAGQARSTTAGLQTELSTGLSEFREFRKAAEPTLKTVPVLQRDVGTIKKAIGEEATVSPNTSALVAGPGAPAPKGLPASLAKQEGPITLINPSAAQLKKLEDDERPRNEVRLYGPTDEARQKVFDGLRATVKQAGFDPNTISPRSLNAASTRVEIDFGPIPDTVKAARKAPTP